MSFAAFKMMHPATGIEHCASGFITHTSSDSVSPLPAIQSEYPEPEWQSQKRRTGAVPNLVVSAGNVLEVYKVRVQEDDGSAQVKRGGVMEGIAGVSLELVCDYRLHGNVASLAILSHGSDSARERRDSIILSFRDAKISVLEYDDSIHGFRTSSMHCFEGPDWQYLKQGRETFHKGPVVRVDPLGRCGGVLIYDSQMIVLKATQAGYGLVADEEASGSGSTTSASIESSYVIGLRDLDIQHVKDFVFVHGYIEPMMVVLHEKQVTWAGSLSSKHHTVVVSAHSISTALKQNPLIWTAHNLPHDAYKLLAVPSPIGGVLVICANSLHYHSQSVSCSLAVNDFFIREESSLVTPKSDIDVELDAANVDWLSNDVAIFSTKSGELLLLTLVYDGRNVRRLELFKSKASVLSSGITAVGNSYFFLGSRLGDSLLVQYSYGVPSLTLGSANGREEVADIEGDGPILRRFGSDASDIVQDISGAEELSFATSASSVSEPSQLKKFCFSVRDSLVNVGPLKDFAYGLRINADTGASGMQKPSNYELVCCSGHAKNGSVCIMQQSLRPELITEVELPQCKGIWTVYHKSGRTNTADALKSGAEDTEYHAYLIISLENRTMVLETADLLGEVTESVDYYVQGSTLAAGNLFGRRRVVQVYACGARILDGPYRTQEVSFGAISDPNSGSEGPTICAASIADPYVLLQMTDGRVQLLIGDPEICTVSKTVPKILEKFAPISSCTLYNDRGPEPWLRKTSIDAWLSSGIAEPVVVTDGMSHDQGDIYCAICYGSGTLEIFDVPGFSSVYRVDNFVSGMTTLRDSCLSEANRNSVEVKKEVEVPEQVKEGSLNMKVVELSMNRWSGQHARPFLFAILADGTVLCYHAFVYEGQDHVMKTEPAALVSADGDGSTGISRLKNLRFVRICLESLTREESFGARLPRITFFKNVGACEGLFLSGARPAWIMMFRERLRVHPQVSDGAIVAFTVLHNVNCNHGLIYVTSQGFLKICQLPSTFCHDSYWPVRKIPLRGTPHQITYFAEKNLYALIVSTPVLKPVSRVLSSLVDQEASNPMDQNMSSVDMQKLYVVEDFEVRLLEPEKASGSWETRATIPMQPCENAITVRMVPLFNTSTKENETLLAVGTGYVQGEDVAARGRIILFSIGKSNESQQTLATEVFSKELKGAISALAALQGHLLIASGPKIILHKWTGTDLNGVAFFDAPLYVVSINIVKNFILLGDIHKSIYFLSWKEHGAQLSLLAKDFGSLNCFATEFLIDGTTLSLVVSDDQKNVQVFYYAPKLIESWKGQKLLPRAEFHAGAHITKFLRLQMLSTTSDRTAAAGTDKSNRFALLFGTLDGSIGCISPLDELTYRRLQALQKKLVDDVPHTCGLNPRSFRQFYSNGKVHRPGPDNMVDCELLCHYEMLPLEKQLEIAHQIGTTRSQIITNLNDIIISTSFL